MTNFALNIDHVAKLDNSLAMSLVLAASNVALKAGSTYDVSTNVSIYNRTTSITEYKTVVGTFNTTNIDTYLTSIKTQLELVYPVTVSHSTSVGVNSVSTSSVINVDLVVNSNGYYVRGMVMTISLSGVQQYSIDATLVSPLEITPAILNTTPESLASLNSMSITTVAKASEASVSAASALNSLNTFNAAYAATQTSLDLKAPLASPSLVTPNIGVATGTSFNGITGLSSTTPNMDGTAAIGTSTRAALADHVHPNDTSKSDLITTVVKDSDTGAAHMPAGTTAQRPASPLNGYMRYNSDLLAMEAYVNGVWGSVGSVTTSVTTSVATLVFTKGLFYAGWSDPAELSTTTLLSSTATLVQAETSVGTARSTLAGANVGTNALFYGGYISDMASTATLLSTTAVLLQAEVSVGTPRFALTGASVDINALFYAGATSVDVSIATVLSPTATLVQAETSVGTARECAAGANVGTNALFYGGDGDSGSTNKTTLLSPTVALIQSETSVGTVRTELAGANVGTNALFYGGYNYSANMSIATLLSPTAVSLQAEVSVGTARVYMVGANVGTNALFYGGDTSAYVSITTLLSPTAILVQAETSVGTAREALAGASL